MVIDSVEAQRLIASAMSRGQITITVQPKIRKVRAKETRPRQKRVIRGKQVCSRCGRTVMTVNGNMVHHRAISDKRGYGNGKGAWCEYPQL